jgi:hypothetical protein
MIVKPTPADVPSTNYSVRSYDSPSGRSPCRTQGGRVVSWHQNAATTAPYQKRRCAPQVVIAAEPRENAGEPDSSGKAIACLSEQGRTVAYRTLAGSNAANSAVGGAGQRGRPCAYCLTLDGVFLLRTGVRRAGHASEVQQGEAEWSRVGQRGKPRVRLPDPGSGFATGTRLGAGRVQRPVLRNPIDSRMRAATGDTWFSYTFTPVGEGDSYPRCT